MQKLSNEAKALALYERGGPDAVIQAVERGYLATDGWAWCLACDADSPMFKNRCLVCSTHVAADEGDNPYIFDPKTETKFVPPKSMAVAAALTKFPPCEYCGALDQPRPEPKVPGEFYCPNCKGVR